MTYPMCLEWSRLIIAVYTELPPHVAQLFVIFRGLPHPLEFIFTNCIDIIKEKLESFLIHCALGQQYKQHLCALNGALKFFFIGFIIWKTTISEDAVKRCTWVVCQGSGKQGPSTQENWQYRRIYYVSASLYQCLTILDFFMILLYVKQRKYMGWILIHTTLCQKQL